jgi:hypothetical protein
LAVDNVLLKLKNDWGFTDFIRIRGDSAEPEPDSPLTPHTLDRVAVGKNVKELRGLNNNYYSQKSNFHLKLELIRGKKIIATTCLQVRNSVLQGLFNFPDGTDDNNNNNNKKMNQNEKSNQKLPFDYCIVDEAAQVGFSLILIRKILFQGVAACLFGSSPICKQICFGWRSLSSTNLFYNQIFHLSSVATINQKPRRKNKGS